MWMMMWQALFVRPCLERGQEQVCQVPLKVRHIRPRQAVPHTKSLN